MRPSPASTVPKRRFRKRWVAAALVLVAVAWTILRAPDLGFVLLELRAVRPPWLVFGALLPLLGFLVDAALWRGILQAAAEPTARVGWRSWVRLSATVHFLNGILPSGGLSGGFAILRGVVRRGHPTRTAVMLTLVTALSFYAAYALAMALAWMLGALEAEAISWARALVPFLVLGGVLLSVPLLRRWSWLELRAGAWLSKWGEVDRALLMRPSMWLRALGVQLLGFALEVACLFACVRALGAEATVSVGTVLLAWMFGTLARSAVPVLHGLGVMEAAIVFQLERSGVPVSRALAAAVLFRALRFWWPLLPGALAFRWEMGRLGTPKPASGNDEAGMSGVSG